MYARWRIANLLLRTVIFTLLALPLFGQDVTVRVQTKNLGVTNEKPLSLDPSSFIIQNNVLKTTTGASAVVPHGVSAYFDGGGQLLTAGKTIYVTSSAACTIKSWSILVDSGTASVDVWKIATGLPTLSNSITASATPTLSTGQKSSSSTLTAWSNLSVAVNDVIAVNLKTVTGAKLVSFSLQCQ